jgi:hypothetical protein
MGMNLPLLRGGCTAAWAAFGLALGAAPAGAQGGCPDSLDARVTAAWSAYRADSLDLAATGFAIGARCGSLDAAVGLGFVALRRDQLERADSLFGSVLARDSAQVDAWEGEARTAWRLGDRSRAVRALAAALRLAPHREDLREWRSEISPDWDRPPIPPAVRPDTMRVVFRTAGTGFEALNAQGKWAPIYMQGVNLGVALPGRYPSQFPLDSALYAGWLDTLAAMHANVVRVYTILPPAFYRALRGWNLHHPDRALWLVHGVWTELPPGHDFDNDEWKTGFRQEMRRVVDVIHGSVQLPPRPGHASGRYDADVSRWTAAYIIGREWEPFAVKAYDSLHPGQAAYEGRYLSASIAPAMDRWLAEQCDYLLAYEVDRWNALRPIAYTNWPTLDPLVHPTESTASEEREWRRRVGRPVAGTTLEYDNDAIGLDANLIHPTARNPAGWFASYHAYPYYPDFMLYDPGYLQARSSEGPSNYYGYLRDLARHHAGLPFVISEYGVPSSRGDAHRQPQGWDHGGHDEISMAAIDARLTRDIRESGAAGAILFAWTDEWFKKNWIVIDFERPGDRNRLWLNAMDAEQNYGILGQYPGIAGSRPALGGDPAAWMALEAVEMGTGLLRAIRAGSDEGYVYLALQLAPEKIDWDSLAVAVAIDTYRPEAGQLALPAFRLTSDIGFEFLLTLESRSRGDLAILPAYNPYVGTSAIINGDDFGRFYRRPATIGVEADGRFEPMFVITNRARFGRDGTFFPAQGYDRGRLRYGTAEESSLNDWYADSAAGLLEVRIPWGLLNVTDPSSRTVLFDRGDQLEGEFGTAVTEGMHFGAIVYRTGGRPAIVASAPAIVDGTWRASDFRTWTWPTWEKPTSHSRLKPVYDSLRATWQPH